MAHNETPEWETSSTSKPRGNIFSSMNLFRARTKPVPQLPITANAPVPETAVQEVEPHSKEVQAPPGQRRRYCGRSRNQCMVLFIIILCLLVLILGLSIGLKKGHKSSSANLPLPTNSATFTGDLTYYSPGPGYGACGYQNTSSDAICAVSHIIWDAASTSANSNDNPLCGKMIRITRYDATSGGNHSVDVEVVDRCTGCVADDLDLSLKMFTSLAAESLGRVTGSWAWLN